LAEIPDVLLELGLEPLKYLPLYKPDIVHKNARKRIFLFIIDALRYDFFEQNDTIKDICNNSTTSKEFDLNRWYLKTYFLNIFEGIMN